MKPNKICPALVVLALSLIVLLGIPAVTADEAAPQLPQGFYGKVEAGSSPVGPGLIVEAVGPGVSSKMDGNPVTTLADGSYGVLDFTSQKLIVQGDIEAGTPLTFYVGATQAEVYDVAAGGPWNTTYSFQPGEITELNLRIASMPAAGQTREPTPVQTIVASSTVAASPHIFHCSIFNFRRIFNYCFGRFGTPTGSGFTRSAANCRSYSAILWGLFCRHCTARNHRTGKRCSGCEPTIRRTGKPNRCPGSTSRIREYDTVYCRCNTPAPGNRWRSLLLHTAKEERD